MKTMISILTLMVISMLFASACVQGKPEPTGLGTPGVEPLVTSTASGTGSEGVPEPPASTPVDPVTEGEKIVTLADQGKTITLAVGENFLLKLGEQYAWEVNISDQNIVSRVRNIMVVRGAQGVYEALQPGTATLTAMGDPLCRQSKPACEMPSIEFMISIVVK